MVAFGDIIVYQCNMENIETTDYFSSLDSDNPLILATGLDFAIVGHTDSWSGGSRPTRLVYDAHSIIEKLVADGLTEVEAHAKFETDIIEASADWGANPPIFVWGRP